MSRVTVVLVCLSLLVPNCVSSRPAVDVLDVSRVATSASALEWPDCSPEADGHVAPHNISGPFMPLKFFDVSWDNHRYYTLLPSSSRETTFPVMIFMHGSASVYEMYSPNLELYASHGFALIYPFVQGPKEDHNWWVTNTNGDYIVHAVEYAKASNENATSPFYKKLDLGNIIIAGHSMGGTCSIMAAKRLPAGAVKLAVTQHPGICGPFGPPPSPDTWLKADLKAANTKFPMLFTTATNDDAFWPAPQTAEHELGCFKGSESPGPIAFVQFSTDACKEDHARDPYADAGHTCAFKVAPETPWVTTAIKLYGQQGGRQASKCYSMLWGEGSDSLRKDPSVEKSVITNNHSALSL